MYGVYRESLAQRRWHRQGDSLSVSPQVEERLEEEFRLIRRHHLAGFFLLYREMCSSREIMEGKGMMRPETPSGDGPRPGSQAKYMDIVFFAV